MPLLSLMFLLLGIFSLILLLNGNGTIHQELRQPCGCGYHGNERALVLVVSPEGVADEKGAPIAPAELPARIAHYRDASSRPGVSIRGTDRAKYGEVIGVLDLVRQAGIERVSVETFFVRD